MLAVFLVENGVATLSEAAKLAGISRQRLHHHCRPDYRDARRRHLETIWEKASDTVKTPRTWPSVQAAADQRSKELHRAMIRQASQALQSSRRENTR
jgi:hypothetical protein